MNHFISTSYGNRELFSDMHSAQRIADQTPIARPIKVLLLRVPDIFPWGLSAEQTLKQPDAPGEHKRPKQEPEDTSQNSHLSKAPSVAKSPQ